MKTGKPIIYWDTCIYLAWIKNEVRKDNEMDGVEDVANKISKNHVRLISSEILFTEILEITLDDVAKKRLADLFKHRNCTRISVGPRVSQFASEIRSYYLQQKTLDGLTTVTTPDAIHLATAILYDASEFHTFDKLDKPGKSRGLLTLNGNVAGYPLVICKPPIPSKGPLFDSLPLKL